MRKERQLAHKKKKAGKPLKDPAAPKKPLSAFMIFSNSIREKVRAENPGARTLAFCTCCAPRDLQRSALVSAARVCATGARRKVV